MILTIQNSSILFWLPIYTLNDKFHAEQGPLLFALIQITSYFIMGYIIVKTCSIFLTIKVFHDNMNILMAWFLFQWFEGILAKLVVLPYQVGLITIGNDKQKTFYSWWSDSPEDIVKIQSVNEILPLYMACCVLWHYMYSMIFAILAIGMERVFATIYIEDYEKVPRRHIPVILIIITNLITIPFAYQITNNHIPFWLAYGICFLNGGIVFFGFLIIWRINLVMRKQMTSGRIEKGKYSLARKFQVEENIRSLSLAKKLVIVAVLYISASMGVLIFMVFGGVQDENSVVVHLLDAATFFAAPVMCITLLFCSPHWKINFIRGFPGMKNYGTSRVTTLKKSSKVLETNVYFEQLRNSWV